MIRRYDLVVIGGGTAGLVAAVIAAGVGARVILIERERTGGDCLWTGCVPSKSLLAAADLAHRMRTAGAVGLAPVEPRIDFARVMAHVDAARRTIEPHDSPERLRRDGVEVVHGEARFVAPGRVEVEARVISYRAALIATGSRPLVPAVEGLAEAGPLTSETLWDLRELPRRLVVMGGGPIGCELGQAFARLGSDVTLIEQEDRLLGKEEPEASRLVAERLDGEGVRVLTGAGVARIEGGTALVAGAGDEEPVAFDQVIAATGRRPDTDDLGLEAVGVALDEKGAVRVDERLRTTGEHVFAAGDVTGALPFTHVAAYHARVAAVNALFLTRRKADHRAVPWVTFTDPEVARVGLTEAAARGRYGDGTVVATHDYAELDRAITAGRPYGFAKLVGDHRGRLVGATVAAPAAGEAIAELAATVRRRGKIGELSEAVHAYPTFAEGPARAADDHLSARYFNARVRAVTRPLLAAARVASRAR